MAEKKVSLNIQISIDSCIKLLVRPKSVKGHLDDVAASLTWYRQGNQLEAVNGTPFYMNLDSLKVGRVDVHDIHYISHFSSYMFALPSGETGKVSWTVINDYGGKSKVYQADMR